MLAAAAFAIFEAENATPADAPSKFTAGVINGFNPAVDVQAEMAECFTPDQAMADDVDGLFAAIEAKDFGSIKSIILKDEPLALKDTAACMNDPKYAARKAKKQAIYEKYNLKLIELADEDVASLDDVLPRKLLKFGVQAY